MDDDDDDDDDELYHRGLPQVGLNNFTSRYGTNETNQVNIVNNGARLWHTLTLIFHAFCSVVSGCYEE